MSIPIWAYAHETSPEQSKRSGPFAPHTYDLPTWLSASCTTRSLPGGAATPITGTGMPQAFSLDQSVSTPGSLHGAAPGAFQTALLHCTVIVFSLTAWRYGLPDTGVALGT